MCVGVGDILVSDFFIKGSGHRHFPFSLFSKWSNKRRNHQLLLLQAVVVACAAVDSSVCFSFSYHFSYVFVVWARVDCPFASFEFLSHDLSLCLSPLLRVSLPPFSFFSTDPNCVCVCILMTLSKLKKSFYHNHDGMSSSDRGTGQANNLFPFFTSI